MFQNFAFAYRSQCEAQVLKFIHYKGGVLIVFPSKLKKYCSLKKCINFEKWKLRAEGELGNNLELPKNGKPLPFAQHLVIYTKQSLNGTN